MVTAVHAEEVIRQGDAGGLLHHGGKPLPKRLRLRGQLHGVVVPVCHIHRKHPRAVGGLPEQLALGKPPVLHHRIVGKHVVHAPPEDGGVDAEAPKDLGRLGHVAEGIGKIAHRFGDSPHFPCHSKPHQHIADVGLTPRQVFVLKHVPGTHANAPLADEGKKPLPHLGADGKIVLNDDHLPIQVIGGIGGISLHQLDEGVKKLHKAESMLLKGQIPLSVPMGMRDNM